MTGGLDLILRLGAAAVLVIAYYRYLNPRIPAVGTYLARRGRLTARHSVSAASAMISMVLVGLAHVAFGIGLVILLRIPVAELGLGPFPPVLALYGVLLGIGLSGAASLICRTAMAVAESVAPRRVPGSMEGWLTLARGGWMRHYLHNIRALPLPVAVLTIGLQIGAEEFVFRAVMVNFFLPGGALFAVLAAAALFTLIQIFQMPNALSALFPVIGALAMGLVHGALFLHVPYLWPLIIAHLTFFMANAA
ncbi:hypothetical protein P1J78_17590 [Psychromarinibacter sp. C21-152]|uniref:CAAX prenyl protease 2/Lysostaphin resistance protein A-like domain-containing protein n=1 Tax=Psychromarinibacter sediminicola TaxID=3033385 RepID=A0AAE3T9G0_9RHOB|nr:CPBP family glutamic-type intramembrane protease [Psychromarinibacter sediminicola]MDF0602555.1 hypothetical protein [Psychromarinibacter sediminicola]